MHAISGNGDGGIVSHLLLKSRAVVCASKEEWLETRRTGIGGSEAAAIVLGVTHWSSRYAVWQEKTGKAERSDMQTSPQLWGHLLEPVIARRYETVTGRVLVNPGQYTIARSIECPFMFATHDRLIVKAEGHDGPGILSVKNVDKDKAIHWRDGAPLDYQIQLQHEFAVSGASWGSFAILVGGNDFQTFDVEANPGFIEKLKADCFKFWGQVERDEEPEIDGSEATFEALKRRFPDDDGETVELPPESADWDVKLVQAENEIAVLQQNVRYYKNQIIAKIGPASYGKLPDGSRYSYKLQRRRETVQKASEYRKLLRLKSATAA